MDLSIIIVNYNTYNYIRQCVGSIYESNKILKNTEIIVIDNASSDNSVNLLKQEFHSLIVIANSQNIGFSAANNIGIRRASGKFILLLNPDSLVKKNTLETILKFMTQNPDVGVSTCRVELPTGQLDDACHRGFPTPWNSFCEFTGISSIFPKSVLFNGYHLGYRNLDQVHQIDSCAGAFMFVNRNALDQVGCLDEDYFWYGEDLDLCYRLKLAGWKIIFFPSTSVIHYKGVSSGIKKNSVDISTATDSIKLSSTISRFEVMRTFYKKHYLKKYPKLIYHLVMLGIRFKEYLSITSIKK
ncbi:hypothetical protein A2960_01045 [Candidatus Gottesmanbacteria bacterium RIFCSPLOWO2_01_FULL_39_12b]|uniref:Glycosyltransferase 2-like domain-containing protein n=1 Tax=Candidatus Gottesmanbacteria bacterium RIFCSPLOWO2_01_FULL_39_12b TaxID=1798388 RepID=A0A1F6AR11_9BACT|nr:MAG: hypothetical protein A2960_01045 [Candidatus Gottesmanbacteria bacterium RIFCSPLOWO2_01_FULL_39_12b]